MVVIGIDFGNDSCVVCLFRDGRIDITNARANNLDTRNIPSVVTFSQRKREFGLPAKQQWSSNIATTICDFKNIMGLTFTRKWKFNLLKFTEFSNDLTFQISIRAQRLKFSPCQILAMVLSKIKADVQASLQSNEKIMECVIAVPSYFNDQERKSVLMAAAIARLDCHFLIKETTAVAINYSLYKKFSKPVYVIFMDFGQNSTQISACKFSEKQLEVIAEVSELIGGRDIDETLAEYFMKNFRIYGASKTSKIFSVQFLQEVEEFKKKLCANSERQSFNFTHLFDCTPISMDREEMEKVCATLFQQMENLMQLCLERSKLKVDEIHSIEMVGGSSRIPIIATLAKKVFGKAPIATMNRDEAVARGCLMKSALDIKRKSYKINERPFIDNYVHVQNPSSSEIKENVRLFQVHRFLKCDCRDAFNITDDEFVAFVEMEKRLTQYDINEVERQEARNKLNAFLTDESKPDGVFGSCSRELSNEIMATRVWDDGSKQNYLDLLDYWTRKAEKIKKRKLLARPEDAHRKPQQSGVDQQSVKKISFEGYVKVSPIRQDQLSTTKSEVIREPILARQVARLHRRGVRARHRRQDPNININANQNPSSSRNDGSQNLLIRGQKKKRLNWCCYL